METAAQTRHRPDRDDDRLDRLRAPAAQRLPVHDRQLAQSLSQYVSQARTDYGPISLADKELAIIVIAGVTIVIACILLLKTRLGKAMRAVSDNPALSASSGMRVDGVIASVWILGTALTGLSGVLLAINSQVNFLMGFKLLLLVFAAVTLGGLAPSGVRSSGRW